MKKFFPPLVIILASPMAQSFTDWENSTFSANPITLVYKTGHASAASDSGLVHTAFIVKSGDQDQLSYLRKNVYFPPSGTTIAPFPTAIAIGNNIANIQIQHDDFTDKTHFAYTRTRTVSLGGGILFLRDVQYSILDSGTVTTETIASFSTFDGETTVSLALGFIGENPVPAVSFYDPTRKSLKYSRRQFNGTWPIEEVDRGTGDFAEDIGINSDLAFSVNGLPRIICEERRFNKLIYYFKNQDNSWGELAIPADPGLPGDPLVPVRVPSQPSLAVDELTFHLTYTLTRDNSQEIVYRKFLLLGFSREVVDSVDTTQMILNPSLSQSSIGISYGRIVISYTKNTGGISGFDRPYVARGTSDAGNPANFTSTALPQTGSNDKSPTSLSFDQNFYPIITWAPASGGRVVAAYCPDFTDKDKDGAIYLLEQAFRMDPNTPDAHLLPKASVVTNVGGENPSHRFLVMTFRTAGFGTVDTTTQTITAGPFLYTAFRSTNLRNINENPDNFRTVVNSDPPPFPPDYRGLVRTTTPLGTPDTPKEFLTVHVFRR